MRNSATYYLRRYPATAARFRRVMLRKIDRSLAFHGGDRDEAEALLAALTEQLVDGGWLDDRRFTDARVQELHRRGTSRRGIAAKMAALGAPRELVDDALARLAERSPDPEREAAVALARRRRLGPSRTDPEQRAARREKNLAALARAGFGYGIAKEIIDCEDPAQLIGQVDSP